MAPSTWNPAEEARRKALAGFGYLSRRRAKARQRAAQALVLDRLDWMLQKLNTHLDRAAAASTIMSRELA
jgi:hypothetical protein